MSAISKEAEKLRDYNNFRLEGILKTRDFIGKLGFSLPDTQLHTQGERFLMATNKLVLVGKDKNDQRIVVKTSRYEEGKREIEQEKKARDILEKVSFAQDVILFPKEIYFGYDEKKEYVFWISEFIEQEKVFVSFTLEEQFFMILRAFESQESFQATTFEHIQSIESSFRVFYARDYLEEFRKFQDILTKKDLGIKINNALDEGGKFLESHKQLVDKYCNHLVHSDFVPHNFRVKDKKIYMLDCASVFFGNKYEGWTRFLNYMVIHNPELERLLARYIKDNRGEEELLVVRLMRIYKIGFLIKYYAESLDKTSGDLRMLTKRRIEFWSSILEAVNQNSPVSKELINKYKTERDKLRSEYEKERQREFAIA